MARLRKTMKFRHLYWVTETLAADGTSAVRGVFTSIPDLIERGLTGLTPAPDVVDLRVTLVQLDRNQAPLGSWRAVRNVDLATALQPFIDSGEFEAEECHRLAEAFRTWGLVRAA